MMYNLTHLLYKSCSRKSSYSKIASKLATMCRLLLVVVVVVATFCGMFCFAVFRAAFDLCVDFVHIYLQGGQQLMAKVMKYAHEQGTNCL